MIAERVGPPGARAVPRSLDRVDMKDEARIPVRFAAAKVAFPPGGVDLAATDADEEFDEAVPPSAALPDEAGPMAPFASRPPGEVVDAPSPAFENAPADVRAAGPFPDLSGAAHAIEPPWSHALFAEYELMETLAAAAVAAEDDEAAASLIAASVPLALRFVRDGGRPLWPALPGLIQSATRVTRRLFGRSAARPLIGLIPVMLRRSVTHLANDVVSGEALTPRAAARIFNRHAAAVLNQQIGTPDVSSPSRGARPIRRSAAAYDLDYHD